METNIAINEDNLTKQGLPLIEFKYPDPENCYKYSMRKVWATKVNKECIEGFEVKEDSDPLSKGIFKIYFREKLTKGFWINEFNRKD
jgi:hypothetical protein